MGGVAMCRCPSDDIRPPGQPDADGHRTVMTTDRASASHEWPVPGPQTRRSETRPRPYGAVTTLIVQLPAACTLKLSEPDVPVISVLPEPDEAMSFGRLPLKAFGSVALILKLVAPPIDGSLFPEYVQETT